MNPKSCATLHFFYLRWHSLVSPLPLLATRLPALQMIPHSDWIERPENQKKILSICKVLKFHLVGELQGLHPCYGISSICVWFL